MGNRTQSRRERDRTDVCSVCGTTVDMRNVEDTNGWRWYSDGNGGLHPLCPACPVPTAMLAH